MLTFRGAALYTAMTCAAILGAGILGAGVAQADVTAAEAVRAGEMQKLNFADPKALPEFELVGMQDEARSLSEFQGKWTLVNFWATWCAPCRHEMPSLDALQGALGGEDFTVATVATGRNAVPAITDFFAEAGVTRLPVLRDPKAQLARQMGVAGLPVTVILNPEGQEVGRLIGDADWNSADAQAVISALIR